MSRPCSNILRTATCILAGTLTLTSCLAQAPFFGGDPTLGTGAGTGTGNSDTAIGHAQALVNYLEEFPDATDVELEVILVDRLDQQITGGTGDLSASYFEALLEPEVQLEIARLAAESPAAPAAYAPEEIDPDYPATGPESPPPLRPLGPVPNNEAGCPNELRNCPVARKLDVPEIEYVQISFRRSYEYSSFDPPDRYAFWADFNQMNCKSETWIGFTSEQINLARNSYATGTGKVSEFIAARNASKITGHALASASAYLVAKAAIVGTANPLAGGLFLASAAVSGFGASMAYETATICDSWVQFYVNTRLPALYADATTGGQMPPQTVVARSVLGQSGWTEPAQGSSTSLPQGPGVGEMFSIEGINGAPFGWVRVEQAGYSVGATLEDAINNLPLDLRDVARQQL